MASTAITDRDASKVVTTTTAGTKEALDVNLVTGDIEIGAVEIKDGATDARAVVETDGVDNALVVKQNDKATIPIVYNVTLTVVDTEYSQALPASTKDFRWRCRTDYDVRYAWVTGKVATPTAPYLTLPAGLDYFSDRNNLSGKTLYFASATAGVVVEIEVFT